MKNCGLSPIYSPKYKKEMDETKCFVKKERIIELFLSG